MPALHGLLLLVPIACAPIPRAAMYTPQSQAAPAGPLPCSLGPKLYTAYDGPNTLSTQRFQLPADVTWEGGWSTRAAVHACSRST